MGLVKFGDFERMYEADMAFAGSILNEGEFDKFAQDIAKTSKNEIVTLNPMLVEYQKIKKDAMSKRVKANADIAKETDAVKKEKLNDDLVKVNMDEEKKLALNEKKLAKWVEDKTAPLNFLMRSKLKEIDLEIMQEEYKAQQATMSDTAKKRMDEMIKSNEEALKVRVEKMEKMLADEAADTKPEDAEIADKEEEAGDAESDYDASGDVSPEEKKVRDQKKKKAENSPLNQI